MKKYYIIILLSFLCSVTSFAQHITLNVYNNQNEIKASGSITLTDGFYIPAGNSVHIFTTGPVQCIPFAGVPSINQNYISTRLFKMPGVKMSNIDSSRSNCEVNQAVQYFDGLGRPVQNVTTQGSPESRDIIQPYAYDVFGRESIKYLPYTDSEGVAGSFRSNALKGSVGYANSAQKSFYSLSGHGYKDMNTPYSVTVFEASPLDRITEEGFSGDAWQPIPGSNTGHTMKTEHLTNAANEVKLWTVNNGSASSGTYLSGKLHKTILKDENWTPANGKSGTQEEFKDFNGRIVLKRIWETDSISLSTYYVYDKFGNTRYVLPPAVNENGISEIYSFDETQQVFDKYIYAYHFDGNQRVVEKKIPGKGWEDIVYNKIDQVVLTRDAVQRSNGKWAFVKYDALGRAIITGIINSTTGRPDWQANINGQTTLWEIRDDLNSNATGTGYTNNTLPSDNDVMHYYTINYYDDYVFFGNTHSGPGGGESSAVKSLPTGSKVNVLNNNTAKMSTMMLGTTYYDEDGKVLRTSNQNVFGGSDEVVNTWNFADELKVSTRTHSANGLTTTILNSYEYDNFGRKKIVKQKINDGTDIILSRHSYNEIGQLTSKELHSTDNGLSFLQSTQYAYNERGWLKDNVSNELSFRLKYEDGSVPQHNGNVANQEWGVASSFPNVFNYGYDKLNRLTSGTSTGIMISEALTYDVMGNIISMNRDGNGISNYSYTGNRLNSISGPLTTGTYVYDLNGNATTDGRSGVTIAYNLLNLPLTITKSGVDVAYTYDATGDKLSKISNGITTQYISGIEYVGNNIDVIHTEEGVARNNGGTYSYEYNLTDYLGNVRYTFNKHPSTGAIQRLQSDDYYAFGKRKSGSPISLNNKYLYNGKEIQDELSSTGEGGQYDYGARFYDPVIARWNVIDKMSEKYYDLSTYNYAVNNPVNFIDPDGNDPTRDQEKAIARGYQLMFYRSDAAAGKYGPIAQSDELYRQHFLTLRKQLMKEYFSHGGRYPESGGAGRNVSSFGSLAQKMAGALIVFTPFGAIGAATKAGRQGNIAGGVLAGISFFAQMGTLASFGGAATKVASSSFSGVRAASTYLQELGVARVYRKQILESFRVQTISLKTAGNSTFGLRFYGGAGKQTGHYLFPTFTETTNRAGLALPKAWNDMSGISQFQVKPGSVYIYGRAASQGGIYTGGNYQMYIPHLKNLRKL
ncbi:DUF6443 domain-containing protein [Pedobacter heparinus]|uniref:DUF6443 domain-containing protein n=1 Tax=Pedobacter heparinus TaxID=984 RepID=UPI00292E7909|nr:DUF6443 domain-containing protein [Pedobacter heparinus]